MDLDTARQLTEIESLYDQFADPLYHYLRFILARRSDADDVLQEVFVRLVKHREAFQASDNIRAYLFRTARNEAFRWLERQKQARRKEERAIEMAEMDPLFYVDSSSPGNESELAETVQYGLAQLPPDDREVVVLRAFHDLSFAQIAETVSEPIGTVSSRYYRALDRLQNILGDEHNDR